MKQRTNFRTRLLSEFSDVAAGALDAPAAILTVAESSGEMIIATTGLDLPPDGSGSPTLPSFHSELLLGTEPVLVPDARASVPRQHIEGASFEIRAWLGVPIVRRRRGIRAALSVFSAEPRHWSDDDVALGKELAAAAVEHLDLESALAAAESALRARDDTIRLISHDLRNPLNAIQLTAALLLESGEERRHETVERLELIRRVGKVEPGAAMGVVFTTLFAAGVLLLEQADVDDGRTGHVELLSGFGVLVVVERQVRSPLFQPAEAADGVGTPCALDVVANLLRRDAEHRPIQIRHPIVVLQRADAAADESALAVCPAQRNGTATTLTVTVGNAPAVGTRRHAAPLTAAVITGVTRESIEVKRPVGPVHLQRGV